MLNEAESIMNETDGGQDGSLSEGDFGIWLVRVR